MSFVLTVYRESNILSADLQKIKARTLYATNVSINYNAFQKN